MSSAKKAEHIRTKSLQADQQLHFVDNIRNLHLT